MTEQERINRNVNELSQKLLEGCKLLCACAPAAGVNHCGLTNLAVPRARRSDSCPETNVPLVSTKDGRMYSVGNGAYYVRDGGELRKVGKEGAISEPSPVPPPALAAAAGPMGGASPWAGAPALPSPPGADLDSQSLSARVAQKLLEGYTLLSDSCPHTNVPLVQSATGQIYSVGTGKHYQRVGGELHELLASPQGAAAVGGMAPPPPPSMHAQHSPQTQPPPVSYGLPAACAPPPPLSFAAAEAPPPHSPAPWKAPQAAGSADGGATTPLPGRAGLEAGAGAGGPAHPVVESTLAVLYQKLEQARLELLRTTTTEAAAPLVSLVKDLASAIASLRSLPA